jgi:hypothetical protein
MEACGGGDTKPKPPDVDVNEETDADADGRCRGTCGYEIGEVPLTMDCGIDALEICEICD